MSDKILRPALAPDLNFACCIRWNVARNGQLIRLQHVLHGGRPTAQHVVPFQSAGRDECGERTVIRSRQRHDARRTSGHSSQRLPGRGRFIHQHPADLVGYRQGHVAQPPDWLPRRIPRTQVRHSFLAIFPHSTNERIIQVECANRMTFF